MTAAFSGKIFWRHDATFILGYDTATSVLTVLVGDDPDLLAVFGKTSLDLGAITLLGSGKLFVRCQPFPYGADVQWGFTISQDFDISTVQVWSLPYNTVQQWHGYVAKEDSSGVYDPVTGLNWLPETAPGTLWAWNGYDNNGNWVEGRGNASLSSGYDAVSGGDGNTPLNASIMGRWLYREFQYADGIQRYNLDTDVWETISTTLSPVTNTHRNFMLGTIETTNEIVTLRNPHWNDPDQTYRRWIEVYNASDGTWASPIPDVIWNNRLPYNPQRLYSPVGPGGPTTVDYYATDSPYGTGSRGQNVVDGRTYYFSRSQGGVGVDYGQDASNTMWGNIGSLWEMNMANGDVQKVLDIPWLGFTVNGVLTYDYNDPNYYNDTLWRTPIGLTLVPSANIGQLHINLSTETATPNWVSVCPSGIYAPSSGVYMDPGMQADVPTYINQAPIVTGSGLQWSDGSDDTYAEIQSWRPELSAYSYTTVASADFAPIPITTGFFRFQIRAKRPAPSQGFYDLHGLHLQIGSGLDYAFDQTLSVAERNALSAMAEPGWFDWPTITPGEPSEANGWENIVYLQDPLTDGFVVSIWDSTTGDFSPDTNLYIYELRMIISTGGETPSNRCGHFNSSSTSVPVWNQVHLGSTSANISITSTPEWWKCCSH